MYDNKQFTELVLKLAERRELAQPKGNVTRSKHFYRDNVTAITQHLTNLINTYGPQQVSAIINEMINTGDL